MTKTIYQGNVHCFKDTSQHYSFYGKEWDNKEKAIEETKKMIEKLKKQGYKIKYAEIEIKGREIIK